MECFIYNNSSYFKSFSKVLYIFKYEGCKKQYDVLMKWKYAHENTFLYINPSYVIHMASS